MNSDCDPSVLRRTYALPPELLEFSWSAMSATADPSPAPAIAPFPMSMSAAMSPTSDPSESSMPVDSPNPPSVPPFIQRLYDKIYNLSMRIGEQTLNIERLTRDLTQSNQALGDLQLKCQSLKEVNELLKTKSELNM